MTIGIACFGPRSVQAVCDSVLGAEVVGRGSIGGFAVLSFLDSTGAVRCAVTQRDGVNGLTLPEGWREARVAALISSGPDRPEPLIQFLPGADGVGLVTGHRLPNAPGENGVALNKTALARLAARRTPQHAVDDALAPFSEADAGLIAITASGTIGFGNTARVKRRSDLGIAHGRAANCGFALMLNSIHGPFATPDALAAALGDLAMARLTTTAQPHALLRLSRAVRVRHSDRDRVHIDDAGDIVAIESANPSLQLEDASRRTAIYLGAEVSQASVRLGYCLSEVFTRMTGGIATPSPHERDRCVLMRRD